MKLSDLLLYDVIKENAESDKAAITHTFKYLSKKNQKDGRLKEYYILYLGDWNHTMQGKKLSKKVKGQKRKYVGGINLEYLNDREFAELRMHLPEILKASGLKARYRKGAALLPHIFRGPGRASGSNDDDELLDELGEQSSQLPASGAYRTYRIDSNDGIERRFDFVTGLLLSMKVSPEDRQKAKEIADEEGREWKELSKKERAQYIEQAFRERGEEDQKRRKKAIKDKDLLTKPEPEEEEPSIDDEIDVPEDEKVLEPEPTTEPPPGMLPPEPGPGIEYKPKFPRRKPAPEPEPTPPEPRPTRPQPTSQPKGKAVTPKEKISPTSTGGTDIAQPKNLEAKASPPANPSNVVDMATQELRDQEDDRSDEQGRD